MKKNLLFLILFALAVTLHAQQAHLPKREFRGAWIQCVNGQFQGMSRDRMQAELTRHLDALARCHVNVVMFQVRAEADALYASPYEPWSRFLSGRQGTPPSPYWDPLQWMIEQCHARGMELHAWINPYRAKTKGTTELAVTHPYVKNPERFFSYDGQYLFNPGLPENQRYICHIAADITRRYDIDGLHIDDYFYPYPAAGQPIPDKATFQANNNGINNIADWRRYNVNTFIQMLHDTLRAVKPWVKLGVSPFGIYHNNQAGSNIPGSNTRGLQNYDDLYADILLWINKGWVDYTVPQLYWEIGHKTADYATLIRWWSRFAGGRPLVIGQDLERTVKASDLQNPQQNQLPAKWNLQRFLNNVSGNCLWYSAVVANNTGRATEALSRQYQRTPALLPSMPFMDDKAPRKPRKVKPVWTSDGYILFWTAPKAKKEMDKAKWYVVYRFKKGQDKDYDNPENIVAITADTYFKLPYQNGRESYTYAVSALDRLHNESKPVKKSVKL